MNQICENVNPLEKIDEPNLLDVLQHTLGNLVEVTPKGLKLEGTDPANLHEIGKRLLSISGEVTVYINFALGDVCDSVPFGKHGDKAAAIREMYGEGSYRRLLQCQRVARGWKCGRRHDKKVPWSFYKETAHLRPVEQSRYMNRWLAGGLTIEMIQQEKRDTKGINPQIQLLEKVRTACNDDPLFLTLLEGEMSRLRLTNGIPVDTNTVQEDCRHHSPLMPEQYPVDTIPRQTWETVRIVSGMALPLGTRVHAGDGVRIILDGNNSNGNVTYYYEGDANRTERQMQRDVFNLCMADIPAATI